MTAPRHPWLERLAADPARAVDALLRGTAHLPGLQRASPSEALPALLGDLPEEAPEWGLLDRALLAWLQARRAAGDELLGRPGGVERFIRESGEGLRAAWRLRLPASCDWLRSQLLDLLRWADGLCLDATFDLGRPLLTAAAHLQQGNELRFLWLRLCEEAATPRLRHRLDAALLGLATAGGGPAGGAWQVNERTENIGGLATAGGGPAGGPSPDLVIGLARWAARLPEDERAKAEVVQEWRALKAAFPRQPAFWRGRWEALLEDARSGGHPFTAWLQEADPALHAPAQGQPRRAPRLPKDIPGIIAEMAREQRREGLTEPLWRKMAALLDQVEHYADATGESYYISTSCTNIAGIILADAPGHALALTRRALLWAPSNGHAWSVRATALDRLGRPDLAEAVLWEAVRRVPSDAAFYIDLALAWVERGGLGEAEALLRKSAALDPADGPTFVELARVVWRRGRAGEAPALLRGYLGREEDAVALYTLGCLLVAEGQGEAAAGVLEQYRRCYGSNNWTATLERRIAAGPAGQEEVRAHLLAPRQRGGAVHALPWDAEDAERALAAELGEAPRLGRIGRVAEADLLFGLGAGRRADALRLVEAALADPADGYARVVKGLAVPEYRREMVGRGGRFAGSLPVQLALTPDDAPADHWRFLAERFPDGLPLTNLVRLARGVADEAARAALAAWCEAKPRWDDGWGRFLREELRRHLAGEETRLDLATLAHDALTQAVDVGRDAAPLAA